MGHKKPDSCQIAVPLPVYKWEQCWQTFMLSKASLLHKKLYDKKKYSRG